MLLECLHSSLCVAFPWVTSPVSLFSVSTQGAQGGVIPCPHSHQETPGTPALVASRMPSFTPQTLVTEAPLALCSTPGVL